MKSKRLSINNAEEDPWKMNNLHFDQEEQHMKLTLEQIREFYYRGYVKVPGAIPNAMGIGQLKIEGQYGLSTMPVIPPKVA